MIHKGGAKSPNLILGLWMAQKLQSYAKYFNFFVTSKIKTNNEAWKFNPFFPKIIFPYQQKNFLAQIRA